MWACVRVFVRVRVCVCEHLYMASSHTTTNLLQTKAQRPSRDFFRGPHAGNMAFLHGGGREPLVTGRM